MPQDVLGSLPPFAALSSQVLPEGTSQMASGGVQWLGVRRGVTAHATAVTIRPLRWPLPRPSWAASLWSPRRIDATGVPSPLHLPPHLTLEPPAEVLHQTPTAEPCPCATALPGRTWSTRRRISIRSRLARLVTACGTSERCSPSRVPMWSRILGAQYIQHARRRHGRARLRQLVEHGAAASAPRSDSARDCICSGAACPCKCVPLLRQHGIHVLLRS